MSADGHEIPAGWTQATIGDVAVYVQRGKSPKYIAKSDLPVVNQKCVRWDKVQTEHLKFVHPDQWEKWSAERTLRRGDILWNSTGTGTIGRAAIFRGIDGYLRVVADSHVTVIRLGEYLPELLHSWIRSPAIQNRIESMQSGSTNQVELSLGEVLATPVPVPPINEQRRIAERLGEVLARVDACGEHLDRVLVVLERFRQSVRFAAISGMLTSDWRDERGMPTGPYRTIPLGELIRGPLRNGKSVRTGTGPLVLRLSSIRNGEINFSEAKSGDWGDIDVRRFLVERGDFLVARGNGSLDLVGRGGLVTSAPPEVAFPDTMIRIRPDSDKILPSFLRLLWDTSPVRQHLESSARTTAGIWKIAQPDLEAMLLPVPELDEQAEIVRRAESLMRRGDTIETASAIARDAVVKLTPALLAKAFRGELVPQDPNDEPAGLLFERMRAERDRTRRKPRTGSGGDQTRKTERTSPGMLKRAEVEDTHLSRILREHGPLTPEVLWSTSQLGIDDYYDQLKDEEARGLLRETRLGSPGDSRVLEAIA